MSVSNEPYSVNNDLEARNAAETFVGNIEAAERTYELDPAKAGCMLYAAAMLAVNAQEYIDARMRGLPDDADDALLDTLTRASDDITKGLLRMRQLDCRMFYAGRPSFGRR
jgi:hypothetical protein